MCDGSSAGSRPQPEARIGLNGISLGGYVASLVASLEDDPDLCDSHPVISSNCSAALGPARTTAPETLEPCARPIRPDGLAAVAGARVPPQNGFIYAGRGRPDRASPEQVMQLWGVGPARRRVVPRRARGFFQARPVQRYVDAALEHFGSHRPPVAERSPRGNSRRWSPLRPSGGHDQGCPASGQPPESP